MGHRPLLAMALGWVLVVVAVAAVTFVVVDRAGRGVGQASAARTVAAVSSVSPPPAPSVTPPVPSSAAPTPTPTRATPRPTKPVPASTPTPRPTRTPTPKPASTPTIRPAEARTVSFTTQGGTVVATCSGTVLTLDSITPRDGWRFERERDDEGYEVKFKPGAEDVDEVEISIACVGGTPTRQAS